MLVLVKSKTNEEKNGEIMRNTKSALRISILAIAALTLSVSTSGSVSAAVKAGAACKKPVKNQVLSLVPRSEQSLFGKQTL